MNDLLEKIVLRKNVRIKGTDIILLGKTGSIKDDRIQNIKEVVDFLREKNSITSKFITVENEWKWKIVKIAEGTPNADDEVEDYTFYQIFTDETKFLKDMCETTENQYQTVEEVLNDSSNDVFKIREGLYLANIDAYY